MYLWSLKAFAPPKLYLIHSDDDAMKDICMQKFNEVSKSLKLNSGMKHLKMRARSQHADVLSDVSLMSGKTCIG